MMRSGTIWTATLMKTWEDLLPRQKEDLKSSIWQLQGLPKERPPPRLLLLILVFSIRVHLGLLHHLLQDKALQRLVTAELVLLQDSQRHLLSSKGLLLLLLKVLRLLESFQDLGQLLLLLLLQAAERSKHRALMMSIICT
jgi:hypothetical protein